MGGIEKQHKKSKWMILGGRRTLIYKMGREPRACRCNATNKIKAVRLPPNELKIDSGDSGMGGLINGMHTILDMCSLCGAAVSCAKTSLNSF